MLQVSAQGLPGSPVLAGGNAAASGRKMRLRGGGPVMGAEVTTTRPGNGKDFPKKVEMLLLFARSLRDALPCG